MRRVATFLPLLFWYVWTKIEKFLSLKFFMNRWFSAWKRVELTLKIFWLQNFEFSILRFIFVNCTKVFHNIDNLASWPLCFQWFFYFFYEYILLIKLFTNLSSRTNHVYVKLSWNYFCPHISLSKHQSVSEWAVCVSVCLFPNSSGTTGPI